MESKYYRWNKIGSRMLLNTDLKTFNKQTTLITDGNVISNTQYSNYIRPYNEIKCNGHINDRGELRNYDLQYFTLNPEIKDYVLKNTENIGGYLYQFHFYNERKEKVVVGWIFEQAGSYKIFINCHEFFSRYKKYESVINTCLNILKEKNNNF